MKKFARSDYVDCGKTISLTIVQALYNPKANELAFIRQFLTLRNRAIKSDLYSDSWRVVTTLW